MVSNQHNEKVIPCFIDYAFNNKPSHTYTR